MTWTEGLILTAAILAVVKADAWMDPPVRALLARTGRRGRAHGAGEQGEELVLYYRVGCPYCIRVISALFRLGARPGMRNIRRDEPARRELVAGGGVQRVPCLRITDGEGATDWLYESADIVAFLRARAAGAQGGN